MKRVIVLFFFVILLAAASLTLAQERKYALEWWTVDGGGALSEDGRYALHSTIGQPDAGAMSSDRYTLRTGYWNSPGHYAVNLPVVLRP